MAARSPHVAAVTNNPLVRADGHTVQGRRVRDLYRALVTRLSNPADRITQADMLALAELKVAAEAARARLLAGAEGDRDPDRLVRLENLVRRAERRLGLNTAAVEKPSGPTLAEYLANRASAAAVAPGDGDGADAHRDDTRTSEAASGHSEAAP